MKVSDFFPIWDKLSHEQRERLENSAIPVCTGQGSLLQNSSTDCRGLLLLSSGQLRAFISSGDGKEITIYRLFEGDICLFSASCMMNSIHFDVTIEAEQDSSLLVIPTGIYKSVMEASAPLSNYTNEIMASRFTDVMWLIEKIMWQSFDKRLASFLTEESVLQGSDTLNITHEKIAQHLGTAREVVTRMLRYFQSEGLVSLSRGTVKLCDKSSLIELSA